MKKLFSFLLAAMLILGLAACGSTPAASGSESGSVAGATDGAEIVLITDVGDIDDKSFNQGTWEGVVAYAEANNISYNYIKPTEQSHDAYLSAIDLAVSGGAKVIVTPGFLFAVPVGTAQHKYPDVSFILIDAAPAKEVTDAAGNTVEEQDIAANAVGVTYAEEQCGYMAGYAAVKDGYTKLGFMGGIAVPAVVRYGFGFAQGVNDAAKEMGITVELKYNYTGSFNPMPEIQSMASSWYQGGTEIIFACGGGIYANVFSAAETNNAKTIGVDIDQSGDSDTVVTSAIKGLNESTQQMLAAHYEGTFPGGQHIILGAAENSVGLPMSTSRFNTFSQADYDTLFASIAGGNINILKDSDATDPDPNSLSTTFDSVTIEYVTL